MYLFQYVQEKCPDVSQEEEDLRVDSEIRRKDF